MTDIWFNKISFIQKLFGLYVEDKNLGKELNKKRSWLVYNSPAM